MKIIRPISTYLKLIGLAVVFFLTLEFCARLDDYLTWSAPVLNDYSADALSTQDKEGIRRNTPGAQFEKWIINDYGFRGPLYDTTKPDGAIRVVCMGTSETYGGCEAITWPEQLRQKLGQNSCIEVFNPSMPGMRFKQYDEYLIKYLSPFQPDLVIILFNPVTYFVNLDRWPNWETTPPKEQAPSEKKHAMSDLYPHNLLSKLRIIPKSKLVLKRFLPQSIVEEIQLESASKKAREMENIYLNGNAPRESVPLPYVDSLYRELATQINSLRRYGIEVALTTYPTLLNEQNKDLYPYLFIENRRFYVEYSLDGMIDAANKYEALLPRVCADLGVDFIDLKSHVPQTDEYFCDNVHYFDIAADSIASAVEQFLKDKYQGQVQCK